MNGLVLAALALATLKLVTVHRLGGPVDQQLFAWTSLYTVGGGLAWASAAWGLSRFSLPDLPRWVAGALAGLLVLLLGGQPLGALALLLAASGTEAWLHREQPALAGLGGWLLAFNPIVLGWAWAGEPQLFGMAGLAWAVAWQPGLLLPAAVLDPTAGIAALAMGRFPPWARVAGGVGALAGLVWRGSLHHPVLEPAIALAGWSASSGWPLAVIALFVLPRSLQPAAVLALLGTVGTGAQGCGAFVLLTVVGASQGTAESLGIPRARAIGVGLLLVSGIGFTPEKVQTGPSPGILRVEAR